MAVSAPGHAFLEFFSPVLCTIFFPGHRLFPNMIIIETMDSVERGMNSVAMTIIDPLKEYLPSRRSNQRPPVPKACTVPTELWGSASSPWTYREFAYSYKFRLRSACPVRAG